MNIRSFLAGVVCGGALFAAADWLLPEHQSDAGGSQSESGAVTGSVPGGTDRTATVNAGQHAENDANPLPASNPVETPTADTPTSSVQPEVRRRAQQAPRQTTRADPDTDGNTPDAAYWLENRRSELMSEPKDDSWAYYMEQSIIQFLASHPAMSQFEISYIECRTIVCQIQVAGFDRSTEPLWTQVMYDFREQLPGSFYEWGLSVFQVDGRPVFVQTFKRLQESP